MRPQQVGRRGNAMVVVLMLGTLLGFSALSVDVGMIRVADTQLQAAVDAAALSGVQRLDGTEAGITAAINTAIAVAAENGMLGEPVVLTAAEVVVGEYYADTGQFVPYDGVEPKRVNAIRIDHTPPDVDAALGAVAFGQVGYTVSARAMAQRPWAAGKAKTSNCFLPIAVPDCWLNGVPMGTNPPPFQWTWSPSPSDQIGWADPDNNPNTSEIARQFNGQCANGEIEVGQPIEVANGQNNSILDLIGDILNDSTPVEPEAWDSALLGPVPGRAAPTGNAPAQSDVHAPYWGNTIQGPVALIDNGSSCTGMGFTGSKTMTGIAWAVIYDVKSGGSGGKNIFVQLDLKTPREIFGEVDDDVKGVNVFGTGDPALVGW